jgi:hypothetical protein
MTISITRSTPNKRIWITTFAPAKTESYGDTEIIDLKYESKKTQNKEGSVGRLYIQNLSLTLYNRDRVFDLLNFQSPLFNMLRGGVAVSVALFLEESPFTKDLGTFYTTSWEASEDNAAVQIKAVDYLGSVKDEEINEPILDNTSIFACFRTVAERLGLWENTIDPFLSEITLAKFALQGKIGDILDELCALSQSTCQINSSGSGLIVKRLTTIRGTARYPLRYLSTHDYSKSDKKKAGDINPNIITAEYSIAEYEINEIVLRSRQVLYATLPLRDFPAKYRGKDITERPIGAGQPPSIILNEPPFFEKPSDYLRAEITDSFLPEYFEYIIYDDDDIVEVYIWLFEAEDPDAQFTVSIIGKSSHKNILLERATQMIEKRPADYTGPAPGDTPEERNRYNKPQEFEIALSGKFMIAALIPGNKNTPGVFEFAVTKTGAGCKVRVWNYTAAAQEFTISIFGKRVIDSKNTRIIEIRNETDIVREGEIRKKINLSGVADDKIAGDMIRASALFYKTFKNNFSLEPWSDPRFELGDLIAHESQRGYGYTQGVIEEITIDYKGYIDQKLKMLESEKHNRDCRVFSGCVYADRPAMNHALEGYV